MPITGQCPYFQFEKDGKTYCEGAILRWPDRAARRGYVYSRCASSCGGWRQCEVYRYMEAYYNGRKAGKE